jgi:hypothetical protein
MPGRHSKDEPAVDESWVTASVAGAAGVAQDYGLPVQTPARVPAHAPVQPAVVNLGTAVPPFSAPLGTGSAAEAAPVLPAGASARRAVREQKKRRSRRTRLLGGGLVLLLVLAAAFAGYRALVGHGAGRTAAPVTTTRPQTTLLVQVVNAQRQTVAAVLLAHDSRGQGTGFGALVPSGLAVDSSGSGAGTFGSTSSSGAAGASAATLSDVIGVTVDGTWVLDAAGFAALVDTVGGVDVDVDHDVTVTVGAGTQTLAAAGHQHLAGAPAAAFATFLAAQEPEQARLARFAEVLSALLPKLPADSAARAAVLTGLGTHSTATVRPSTLDTFLGGLRSDAAGNRMAFDTLPTRALDLGTGTPTLLIDPTAADTMVKNSFSGSLPAQRPDGPIRVVIQNGVGTPGLGASARTKLVVAGITYVSGGNAGRFGYTHSLVLVPTSSGDAGQKQGQAVAKALGLPSSDVALTEQGQTIADVVVILGADFKP